MVKKYKLRIEELMENKKLPILLAILIALPSLFGCNPARTQTEAKAASLIEAGTAAFEAPNYTASETASKAAKGANAFAFAFSSEAIKQKQSANFACSPFSAWLSLAPLAGAVSDSAKESLLTALKADGLSADDLNAAASRMLYDLTSTERASEEGYFPTVRIANALFVANGYAPASGFAESFAKNYDGAFFNVDFSSDEAVDAINEWAREHTEGLIDGIATSFPKEAIAALADAIYFSDRFSAEFDPALTKDGVFHTIEKDVTTPFMEKSDEAIPYYEDADLQAVTLSFQNGGGLLILLPKSGTADELLASFTAERFDEVLAGMKKSNGNLKLPKFDIDSGLVDLVPALRALGVDIFDAGENPLSNLIAGREDVYAASAVQKAKIIVDEKGTTAAAVTLMGFATTDFLVPTDSFEMVCDKPFSFILYKTTFDGGNQVLFTGTVGDPTL